MGKENIDKENVFLPKPAEIIDAELMTESEKHFKLRMKDGNSFDYTPGQMVEAGIPGFGEIPLGLSSSPTQKDYFELVIRRVGRVSTGLLRLEKGDTMFIRGPLGHGFPMDEFRGQDVLVVAGGIGLCPTRSMIKYILDRRDEFKKFILFYGTRSPNEQLFKSELGEWKKSSDVEYHETVDRADDKWEGNVGVITRLFENTYLKPSTKVIICGPPVMYQFVIKELKKSNIPEDQVYVDLERRMKCGIGKCGHCQINNKYVCVDGPVFKFSEIMHLEEAI
jgi:sulfhydrogenase subunit gamma (sulfur reductase)